MEKNKSIDGLSFKRSKKLTTKKVAKPSVAQKTSPKKITKKPTKTTIKVSTPEHPKVVETEEFISETVINPLTELDTESTPKKKHKKEKKKKEKKKTSKVRKTISIITLILVLALIGGIVWLVLWGNDIIAKITGGQGNIFDLMTFTNENYEPLQTDENGRTNILAFGTSGYNMDGDVGNGTHDGASLTDSIMVISLDQKTGDIAMVSLPRDLKASPTCTATGKINEVYWCNNMDGDNEQAGAEALMAEVGGILGLNFQYYAHLNWGSLVQIVNILDNITVVLDEDIADYGWTNAVYEAGVEYTLNGEEALGLARARHGTSSGDFSRGASQQKILIGIKNKLLEKKLSLTDYLSLASTLGDNLRTNFSVENLKTIAHLSSSFDFENMRQISLIEPEQLVTTGTINGISYVLPSAGVGNYGKIQSYINKMLSSDPRVYESPSITILNGTDVDGLAASEKYTLEEDGYLDIDIGNAPEGEYNDKYVIYTTSEKPGTKNLLEQRYNVSIKPIDEAPENIPKDYDFIIILGNAE